MKPPEPLAMDPAAEALRARWRTATRPGRCWLCTTEFETGDRIRPYADDGLADGRWLAECCGEDE